MTALKTFGVVIGFVCAWVLSVGTVQAGPAKTLEAEAADDASAKAEDLLKCGDGEDAALTKKWAGYVRQYKADAHSGAACMIFPRISSAGSPNYVEIDPSKTYEISGWFRSLKPGQPSRVLLDVRFYTADKKAIKPRSVRPASKVCKLLADAPKGAKEVKVAPSDWPKLGSLHVIVFNAKEDLSDLPNFEYARFGAQPKKTDGGYIVTLEKPLPKAYPAGTGVRLHRYLDYPRVWNRTLPAKWTRMSFKVAAKPVPGSRGRNYFWPGAKYMRVVILHQYTKYPKRLPEGEESPVLLADDITLTEVAP